MLNAGGNIMKAGHYGRQTGGYQAFIPASLPPEPPPALTGDLQTLLSEADRALGRLDGSVTTLPNPDLFVFMYIRKEAVLPWENCDVHRTGLVLQDAP